MKDPIQKHTEELLNIFCDSCTGCQCYLVNEDRQMYVLQVERVFPEKGVVYLALPSGRNKPVDVNATWHATLKVKGHVAKLKVSQVVAHSSFLEIVLHPEVLLFTPRSMVRLNAESRSPVFVNLETKHFSMEGELTDFSTGGVRLTMESDPELKTGDYVYKVRFYLKGNKLCLSTARVAHVAKCHGKWNLGLAFENISESVRHDLECLVEKFKEKKLDYFISVDP